MSTKTVYEHGLPFSQKLAENIKDLWTRVDNHNKAALIFIDGGVGEGKTTLGVEIADYINSLDGKEEINLTKKEAFQIGMGGIAFIKNLRVVFKNGYAVLIYDEGGDFNRRGALTKFNQMMNRIFETYRAFHILVIVCLPSFKVVDGDLLLKGIPRLLLHCENRTKSQGNFKGYSLHKMYYILHLMKKLKVPTFAYTLVEPNFRGHFLNLPIEREKALDKLSTDSKLMEAEKAEISMDGLISQHDLARKLAKTSSWVSNSLKELRMKPERKISKTWYYKEEIVFEALYNHSLRPINTKKKKQVTE